MSRSWPMSSPANWRIPTPMPEIAISVRTFDANVRDHTSDHDASPTCCRAAAPCNEHQHGTQHNGHEDRTHTSQPTGKKYKHYISVCTGDAAWRRSIDHGS